MATQTVPTESPVIRAAGGIIQRIGSHGDEVLIVFRKQQQDWTLPKGEVRDAESFQEAALREVREETGCECQLGNYMGTISYADNGTPKVVMFWKMTVITEGKVADTEEIGEAIWLPTAAAIQKLSHSQEKALLSRVGAAPRPPQTLPVIPETAPCNESTSIAEPSQNSSLGDCGSQASLETSAGPATATQVPATTVDEDMAAELSTASLQPLSAFRATSSEELPKMPMPKVAELSEASRAADFSPAPNLPQSLTAKPPVLSATGATYTAAKTKTNADDGRVHARLLRESEAFRVELAFLERRNARGDNSWAAAAHEQLENVTRCLDSNDIEGGMLCLHAAQRYAVYGLNRTELMARSYILREEAAKIPSWRGEAMEGLLPAGDDELTPERVIDAMALRDEETTNQYYKTRLIGDHLRILLIICSLAVVALLPFMLLAGPARMIAPVLLFGLLGASFSAAHSLMRGKNESRIPNVFIMLTPVLFGAVAGLAGYAIYEYIAWVLNIASPHTGGVFGLAFLFGVLGQRVLSRLAVPKRRKKARV